MNGFSPTRVEGLSRAQVTETRSCIEARQVLRELKTNMRGRAAKAKHRHPEVFDFHCQPERFRPAAVTDWEGIQFDDKRTRLRSPNAPERESAAD
jgi:hypothetical protein